MPPKGPSIAVWEKARKYLADGCVNIIEADDETVLASVRGSEPYEVVFNLVWTCDCPAALTCSHILAVNLVTHRWTTPSDEPQKLEPMEITTRADIDSILGIS